MGMHKGLILGLCAVAAHACSLWGLTSILGHMIDLIAAAHSLGRLLIISLSWVPSLTLCLG